MLNYTKTGSMMQQCISNLELLGEQVQREINKVDCYDLDAPWEVRHFAQVLRRFRNLVCRTSRDLRSDLVWVTRKVELYKDQERGRVII